MICVNTENDIKYRIVIGQRSRNAAYRPYLQCARHA